MAKAGPTENSDGPIHAGVPYAKWEKAAGQRAVAGVDSTSAAYDAMRSAWDKISTVLAGTEAMRAAGVRYLPEHQYETTENWRERRDKAVLDNYTLRTLETLVGKAFRDPPIFNEDVPQAIRDILPDIDGQGGSALAVARAWFREGVAKAVGHLWVDFTQAPEREDGKPRTLADDARDGVRPYWRVVKPEDVLFMQGTISNGKLVLSQVRMAEPCMEPDGEFGEVLVERIRVLRPGSWELYKKVKARNNKWVWVFETGGPYGLDYIPFVSFYTDRTGLGEGKPPLEDLADLNVCHYQSSSDQRSILTVSRFPMLAVSGAQATDEKNGDAPLKVGPKQWLSVADPQGRFYYVEHGGAAIEAGRNDLQDLEQRMGSYGAEFLKKQPGRASATGRALDSSEAMSLLQCWCFDFKDALEQALSFTADWLKIKEGGGTVKFELQPDVDAADQFELATLTAARARGDMSRLGFMTELKRRGVLPDEFDIDKDQDQLDTEGPTLGALGGMFKAEQSAQGLPGVPTTKPKRDASETGTGAQDDKS